MKKQSALIQAVKEKLAFYNYNIGPATVAPVELVFKASKFERGQVAAMSLKEQRQCLTKAKKAIKQGNPDLAQCWLASYKAERNCYNLLLSAK